MDAQRKDPSWYARLKAENRMSPDDKRMKADDPHWYLGYWVEPFFDRHFHTKSARRVAKAAAILVFTALWVSLVFYVD
jgi:hypothetical protein